MKFTARIVTPENCIEALTIDAADMAAARTELEARRLQVLAIAAEQSRNAARPGRDFALLEFSQELAALLKAGLNLVEALEGLAAKGEGTESRTLLLGVLAALRSGKRLSDALQANPDVFPPLFIGLVRSAEGTSSLPDALTRYVDYGLRVRALKSRVVSACIYPAVLLAAGTAVGIFLMTYVVPRFASVYEGGGRPLPWQSAWLLTWGQWLNHHAVTAGVMAGLAILALFNGLAWLNRTGRLLSVLQLLPWIGQRIALLELTRTYLTLGMLLQGGIPARTALDMVAGSVSGSTGHAVRAARDSVSHGVAFSDALARHGLCTPIALRLLRVGERSGQLGPMLTQAANFHEAETARWIERFSRLFEPMLTVIIGLVIGVLVVLLYIPILDLAGGL